LNIKPTLHWEVTFVPTNINNMTKIVIIDENDVTSNWLSNQFLPHSYSISTYSNPLEAIEISKEIKPDFFIIDLNMKLIDGIETCVKIRQNVTFTKSGIILLSDKNDDYATIAALDSGADECLSKPLNFTILERKIQAILNRYQLANIITDDETIDNQPFVIENDDENNQFITIDNKRIELAKKEIQILSLLASKPEKVFSRDEIYDYVWGTDKNVGERTIDVHIRKLRIKIGENVLKTVNGIGYKFIKTAS
jgi:two-component system, OmpR family, alkaline phosphatase synthesis response regulator PhoP